MFRKSNLKSIPTKPGCYIYRDKSNKILYVGKAVNIRNRVTSYFARKTQLEPKIRKLVSQINDVETITVDSEVEALILETNLIKKYKPKYNSMMKDDKNYVWLMFDNTKIFPKPEIVREKKKKTAKYFGPYPKTFPVSKVLRRLRKIFPYCNKNFTIISKDLDGRKVYKGNEKRACLDTHIGLCSGVCAGNLSRARHLKNINNIKRFFRGQKNQIMINLDERMHKYSKDRDFERAAKIRNAIRDMEYVTQRIKVDLDTDEEVLLSLKHVTRFRALFDLTKRLRIEKLKKNYTELSKDIRGLNKFRIECYDISNISGKSATGSLIVFEGGEAKKSDYRKFRIKTKDTPDDFLMMKEVLGRRLKNLENEKDVSFSKIPDLIIIDGGKGQLSSAYKILKDYKLSSKIPIIGLAKKEEELFRIENNNGELEFKKIRLPRRSDSFFLIQRIRDEAHRFAIGYHRKLRSRNQNKSVLDDIPGVGDLTKKRLLKAFGSLDGIKKAGKSDLQTVIKNKSTVNALTKVIK